ncbi:histidine kinase [Labilibaculum sp. DW002]|jgi:histidine kinase|uniref:Histidine kinase n=1 Tax=Paralabilibaculum antarcticum TaxID=2912572 RepID=A0ABT5VTG0_9BACT|nr:histidine kinase [Labilibaculum sp. DW002]MDE5418714.1 histidine kinase [Labilibaculum sp. DW002]
MSNIKKISRSRIAYHILFWVLALTFWLFTMFVASSFKNIVKLEPVLMTLIFNLCFAAAVYFNLLVLIPRLFKKQRFFLYSVSLLITISIAAFFIDFLLVYPLQSFVQGEEYFQELTFFVWFNFAFFTFIYVGVTSFLSLMRELFVLQKISFQLKDIEREKLEAELKALKAQINPHFLFNTLNNIYSLTLDKSDKAPSLVLKLSDLMRYILYDCNDRFVLLEKELDFLNNYLDLQRIRLDDKIPVQMTVKGNANSSMIAPLLFEPLIENAFKHGAFGKMNNGFVNILFNFEDKERIELVIENSSESDWSQEDKKDSGIGIKNVIRRLELLYPEKHNLEIAEVDNLFKVSLKIDLS